MLKLSSKQCKVDNCTNKVLAREMCSKHYTQWRKHGELRPDLEKQRHDICTEEGCNRKHYCKGIVTNIISNINHMVELHLN